METLNTHANPAADILTKYNKEKWGKLVICILIDIIGNLTYFLPGLGESLDLPLAPITGIVLSAIFVKYGKLKGIGSGLFNIAEELIPFTDIIPTATLMWLLTYVISQKKTLEKFTQLEENKLLAENRAE